MDSLTANSALLSWTGGGASSWQIAVRDTSQSAGFIIVNANSNPYWLSNLSQNTTYEIIVRDSCGPGDLSLWSLPLEFTTRCGMITFPYLETFDGPEWQKGPGSTINNGSHKISVCWTKANIPNLDFGTGQSNTNSFSTGPSADYSGTGKYIYTEASNGIEAGKINMPLVIVPDSSENPYLKFAYHMYGSNIHSLKVKIDDGNGSGLVNVWQLNGQQQISSNSPWLFDSISLKAYAFDTITIQFIGRNTGYNGDVAIDEVELKFCSPVSTGITNQNNFLSVNFDTTATTGASHFVWDFGNGKTDSAASALHQYDSAGTYQVMIYAYNDCGKGDTAYKTITVCDTLSADFTTYISGDTLFCNADTTNNAIGFEWNLDDGHTDTVQNSYITYDTTGYKTISLTTYNNCGDTIISTKNIAVCPKPVAHWSYDTLPPIGIGLRLQFTTTNSKYATNYYWDFGDGQTGSGPNPIHTYSTVSYHYQVTLRVENGCGDSDTLQSRLRHIDLEEVGTVHNIHLYPNPTNGLVRILSTHGKLDVNDIAIYSAEGQRQAVKPETIGPNEVEVSLHRFSPGIYFVEILNNNTNSVYKLVKTE